MQPVWVLSVDLQTKTATFQSGLADAAKAARGSFTDIKSGAGDMGRGVSGHMMEARHGVMLLGEEFGVHLPRALTSFIASIGPIGAAMEAAFPFLAIAVGATLLIEHLVKMHEEGEKLTLDQMKFGTAVQDAFNKLDEKLLQAQIRADVLRHDHLSALHHELELINRQSMAELIRAFEEVAKAADIVFKDLKTSWYQFSGGSDYAKSTLEKFQAQYSALLAQGKDKEASDLLAGTRKSAEHTLGLMQQAASYTSMPKGTANNGPDTATAQAAANTLRAQGVGFAEKEVQAQQALIQALGAQASIEQRVADIKKLEGANKGREAGNEEARLQSEAGRESAEHTLRMGELSLTADRQMAQARAALQETSIQERLDDSLRLADKEYEIQLQGNSQKIAALDKYGKDYQTQLKALQDKAEELAAQHENAVTGLVLKAHEDQYRQDLQALEQDEREKIDGTQKGSAERLAAIAAAIREEESLGRQGASYYRDLLIQRVETTRQMSEEEAKLKAEAGKEAAEHELKMGELVLAAKKEQTALENSSRHVSAAEIVQQEAQFANEEYALKQAAYAREMAALDKNAKDYENKLRALQDKETQLTRQHENDITAIKDKAQKDQNAKLLSGLQQLEDMTARGLTQVIMRHQSFATMIGSIGDQIAAGMMQNAIKDAMMEDFAREKEAAHAARLGFLAGLKFPFPANIVMAPALGAAFFAAMMAFEGGGIVPGIGTGDVVPAMLTPGEAVLPKPMTEMLTSAARSGSGDSGPAVQLHYRPTYHVQTIDGSGVRGMLEKHSDEFSRHMNNQLRKMNRG